MATKLLAALDQRHGAQSLGWRRLDSGFSGLVMPWLGLWSPRRLDECVEVRRVNESRGSACEPAVLSLHEA